MAPDQQRMLDEQIAHIPRDVRADFDREYPRWKDSWFAGSMALNSNPASRASGPDFEALRALGPVILPLVIRELIDPDNFLALQLYDVLQTDAHVRVQFGPSDPRIAEGEQGRARRTVAAWLLNVGGR